MNLAGGRRAPAATVGLLVAAVVASALWWSAAGRVVAPGRNAARPSVTVAPTGLTVQPAAGGALVGHWAPAASGPAPASYDVRVVTVDDRRTVATEQAWSPSIVVAGLSVGGHYQMEVAASGGTSTVMSSAVVVLPDRPPDPPTQVVIARIDDTNGIEVRWAPARSGVAADGARVQLYDGLAYQGQVICRAECTSAVFRGLTYGRRYTVGVVATNTVGDAPAAASDPLDLTGPCASVAPCVTIDATAVRGPARHRAMGFLNSLYPVGDMVARVRTLKPQSWRGAPAYQPATGTLDWSSWDAAVATGAQTTLLLSNLWHAETTTGAGARTPWSDWSGYSSWVTSTVRAIRASGHPVSYWEIQNEPAGPTYYSLSDWAASTAADYLEQFRVGYVAVKAADPSAKIIGPSLSHFADYPAQYDAHEPDLVTFLTFAAAHDLKLAAVTWHEIDDELGSQPRDFNGLPQIIESHVAEARRLILARPALGDPEVWVNEYGRPADYAIPGWTLGDIAALEAASIDRAGRSCWPEQGADGVAYDDCPAPSLDGLLEPDGTAPRADYWVYATYARMSGSMVAASSSDDTISVLAARDEGSGPVVAMIGRHVGCLPAQNHNCIRPAAVAVPPVPVTLAVQVPWDTATATVTIAVVPPTWGPLPRPATVYRGSLAPSRSRLVLPLPAVADGEVYLVTVAR